MRPVDPPVNSGTMSGPRVLDEHPLLARLRAGDPTSYEDLVRMHAGRMLAVARRLLRNEDDARDCVQEAFLLAFRGLRSFEGRASLRTWLHRIVVNAALMKIRARPGPDVASLDDLMPEFDADGTRVEPVGSAALPVETLIERSDVLVLVRRAVDRLPDTYRTVLILRDIQEMDTHETARLLQTTASAVKTRLHRARAALKKLLEPHVSGEHR